MKSGTLARFLTFFAWLACAAALLACAGVHAQEKEEVGNMQLLGHHDVQAHTA